MIRKPHIRYFTKPSAPIALIGLICFVLFKAIIPAGFMVKPNSHAGFGLCHGDAKSAALISYLQVDSSNRYANHGWHNKQTYAFTSSTLSHSSHAFEVPSHTEAVQSHLPEPHKGTHILPLLCGYSALQLLVFNLIGLLALFVIGFVPRLYGYQPAVCLCNLYVLALSRAPPI